MVASVVTAMVNQFDIGGIAVRGVHRFQFVENARPTWHAGECGGRFYRRDDGRGPGQSKHTGKKGSSIHQFLLYQCPPRIFSFSKAEHSLNGKENHRCGQFNRAVSG
jgi:hypothetical protein